MTLTKEELQILIQVLNQPRQQDLQTAQVLIGLSNKLSGMIDGLNLPKEQKKDK